MTMYARFGGSEANAGSPADRSALPTRRANRLRYLFSPFELQPSERRLLLNAKPVTLGARALDVLIVLVEYAGSLVTKDDLIKLAWPRVIVEDCNLTVQISNLRKLLGKGAI